MSEAGLGPRNTHTGEPAEGGVVGTGGGKVDGLAKITGTATFVADIRLPRMAHAKLLRSPHAHARIVSVDPTRALAVPGVLGVMTGPDLPRRHGAIPGGHDETALALDKVRYVGEPVACVVATSERIAWEAARLVDVAYEELEPVLSIDRALDDDAPVIHEWRRKQNNVLRRVFQTFGDVDAAFADSDLVLEQTYEYPGSSHVPLEPHVALAAPDGDRLRVWSSTQNPHYLHKTLAAVLQLPERLVRVTKPDVGAGYGGKCDTFVTELCAAHMARTLGRPVRLQLEREEVFYAHRGRHQTRMWLKMGMKRDGTITGLDFKAWADGGAYASYGVVTSYYLGVFLTLPYVLENVRFTSWRLYTNRPPCGPKRGHGAIQPRFAVEVHIDRMCHQLGLDPARVRRQQLVQPNTETCNGLRVTSVGLSACIDRVVQASGYGSPTPPGVGLGLASSAYMCGALHSVYNNRMPHSGVQLKVDRSGQVTVFSGTADVGQGSNHMLALLVAERLGLQPSDVAVVEADTALTPVDLGSYSSRVTFMAGNAAIQAADTVREQVVSAVCHDRAWDPGAVTLRERALHHGEESLPWTEAVELAETASGSLGAMGSYRPPLIGSRFRRQSVGPSPAYSFSAQVARVRVDEETGLVTVEKVWAAHDLGRTLHPEIAGGQVEGCVYMGVGEALAEEQAFRGAHLVTPSILEYRIPTIHETPEIEAILVESHDPEGPYGAKEVGEGPQLPTVPAIANAIYDACGIWLTEPPFTPDKVLRALRERDRQRGRT